jgi:hypothetical protein
MMSRDSLVMSRDSLVMSRDSLVTDSGPSDDESGLSGDDPGHDGDDEIVSAERTVITLKNDHEDDEFANDELVVENPELDESDDNDDRDNHMRNGQTAPPSGTHSARPFTEFLPNTMPVASDAMVACLCRDPLHSNPQQHPGIPTPAQLDELMDFALASSNNIFGEYYSDF